MSRLFSFTLLGTLALAGCHHPSLPTPAHEEAKAEQQAQIDQQRNELSLIPPPSKSRFMSIRSLDSWNNPYIVVQAGMLQLHVLLADTEPNAFGTGGMLRPIGARQQELNISFDKLGSAVSSIPQSSWPYGRVIAVEEPRKVPPAMEPTVRRAMEVTISKLNDLGLVVYDPSEGILR